MRLPKNWKNPTSFLILLIAFFFVGCSAYTANVRPSFDDNYENKFGDNSTNIRPSKRNKEDAKEEKSKYESEPEQQNEPQKIEELPSEISLRGGQYKKAADKYLGSPYRYSGTTKRGFDCSGFIWRVYQDVGHTNFPRESSQMMFDRGKTVKQNSVREGDLVFFHDPKNRRKINHAGIYISEGQFIHSSSTRGVAYSKLTDNYWKDNYVGFKRLLP